MAQRSTATDRAGSGGSKVNDYRQGWVRWVKDQRLQTGLGQVGQRSTTTDRAGSAGSKVNDYRQGWIK